MTFIIFFSLTYHVLQIWATTFIKVFDYCFLVTYFFLVDLEYVFLLNMSIRYRLTI